MECPIQRGLCRSHVIPFKARAHGRPPFLKVELDFKADRVLRAESARKAAQDFKAEPAQHTDPVQPADPVLKAERVVSKALRRGGDEWQR
jgi:hypothetical protein